MTKPKFFKVLNKNGKSCSGGYHFWDLPKNGKPGKWQEIPQDQYIRRCESGFHITTEPQEWVDEDSELEYHTVYLAEYQGETHPPIEDFMNDCDDKIACRKVRLVREATKSELQKFGLVEAKPLVGNFSPVTTLNKVTVTSGKGFITNAEEININGESTLVLENVCEVMVNTDKPVKLIVIGTEGDIYIEEGDKTKVIYLSGVNKNKMPKDLSCGFYQQLFKAV